MKGALWFKKNKTLVLVAMVYLLLWFAAPEKALRSLGNSAYYLLEMLQVFPVVFMLTVVIEALVPRELILRSFGDRSGLRGNLFALLFGSLSAGPIYAAFPICKTLLNKGASVANVVIILSAWAVIKVPMLANEAKFLGAGFMAVRWVLTVAAIFTMAYLTGALVRRQDMPASSGEENGKALMIKEEYCIGCGLCAKMLPEYFEKAEGKARVKGLPVGQTAFPAIREAAKQCPSMAIVLSKEAQT
jgi:uncharacterized membrane protein YraQ (UPF0718 family)